MFTNAAMTTLPNMMTTALCPTRRKSVSYVMPFETIAYALHATLYAIAQFSLVILILQPLYYKSPLASTNLLVPLTPASLARQHVVVAAVVVAVAEVDAAVVAVDAVAAVVVVEARVSFPPLAGRSYRPSVAALWTNSMHVSRLNVRDALQLLTRVRHLLLQRTLKVARAPRQLIMVAINNKQQRHLQHPAAQALLPLSLIHI